MFLSLMTRFRQERSCTNRVKNLHDLTTKIFFDNNLTTNLYSNMNHHEEW